MSQAYDVERIVDVLSDHTGRSRVCTIIGPAGVGKTELLRTVRTRWQDGGADVVRIVGTELEHGLALGLVDQLLAVVAGATHTDRLASGSVDNIERIAGSAVLTALDRLGDGGALLIVDDAHWSDETSRRVLEFALRRLDDLAPATLIASRPRPVPFTTVGTRLHVSGLSEQESAELVRRHDPDASDATVSALHELSAGHPLVLRELLTTPDRPGDDGEPLERRLIRRRIEALPPATGLALALLARRRHGDDVAAAWRSLLDLPDVRPRYLPADDLDAAIVPAIEAGLLRVEPPGGPVEFTHPEYRATAVDAVDASTQRALADALAASTIDPDSEAWHRADAATGRDDTAAELLAASARRTAERGVPIEAARTFEAAAERSVDPASAIDRSIDAAQCWWYAGEPAEVARVLAGCDDLPVDQLRRLRARQLHRAAVGWHRQVATTIRGMLDDAELAAELDLDEASAMRLAAFIEACHAGAIDLAGEIAERLREGLEAAGLPADDPWHGPAAVCRSFASLLAGTTGRADDPDIGLLRLAASVDPRKLETSALNVLQVAGFALMVVEDWDAAADTLGDLSREERSRGATVMTDFTDACLAEVDRRRGRWASALSRCTDELTVDPDHLGAGPAWQRAIRARILASRGDDVTLAYADAVHREAGPVGMLSLTGAADVARATFHLLTGRADIAADLMAAFEQRYLEGGAGETGVVWHELDAIEAFAATGRRNDLERITERIVRHEAATGRRWSAATSRLGELLLTSPTGSSAAVARARSAVDAARRLGDALEATRVELLVAEWCASPGGPGLDAVGIDPGRLRDRSERFGARPLVERCAALVSTAPVEAPANVLTALTAAELRVAVAVAGGRTNAEAAEELYLSVRTVEAHLRSIFRKLAIRNRVELATAMAGYVST